MKTITIYQFKNIFSIRKILFCFVVLTFTCTNAQLQNDGVLFVGDEGYVYVGSDTYIFGSGVGQTTTTRTPLVYGKLIFSSMASTVGVSDSHYLDGYASVISTDPFLLPIGQSGVYAPARVTATSLLPVDGAYYRSSATSVGSTLDSSVNAISTIEYWNIIGANNVSLSLTWRNSSFISNIVSTLSDLTIVGFDGTQWVEIPSVVDLTSVIGGGSSMTSGSITSLSTVDLSVFSYFSLGAKGNSCSPLVASSGNVKTWNGSWSPTPPTIYDPVVINSPYNGGSFECNSLVLNANITLNNNQNIEVVNGVTGSGRIIMSSEASFVQRASGVPAPTIELTKRTRDVMRRFDYVYWGTPIAGNFISQLAAAKAGSATAANAFDLRYRYVTGPGGGWQNLTATETGRGFITRIKSQAPFTNATNTDYIDLKFTGVANNGNITVPITNNPSSPNGGTSHVLLANPYPSALDAEKFLTENTDIDGVLYIWTSGTLNNGSGQLYSQADYIAYTLAGSVSPNGIPTSFNGKIASGQGFKVKSLSNSSSVTFTNCMRLTADNNHFFRSSYTALNSRQRDSYKLNMTGSNAVFSQILVSYMPEATLDYDRMYDAGRNSVSTAQLFTVFEGDGRRLAINARPSFFITDTVPLGISKTGSTAETFTISITEKEGVFNTPDVTVYVHDLLNNSFHNLNDSDFTFTSNQTSLVGRYELIYQTSLSNPEFDTLGVYANINNGLLSIKSNIGLEKVQVFDLTGKKLIDTLIDTGSNFNMPFNYPQAVYIVKVTLDNGKTSSFKLINEN